MDNILISSKPLLCEKRANHREAKFMISVLDEQDKNGRIISSEAGEKCHKSIIGYPIVTKLVTDMWGNPVDFSGHCVTETSDKNNNKTYKFNTHPIGCVTDSNIENLMIDGVEKKCITISSKLWSDRFPEYFEVLDNLMDKGGVSSSWEMSVNESEIKNGIKYLNDFEFVGNCILGSQVEGAVEGAGILECAETNNDEMALASALSRDIKQNKENEVGETMNNEENSVVEATPDAKDTSSVAETEINPVENPEVSESENTSEVQPEGESGETAENSPNEDEAETASVTASDIERQIEELVGGKGIGYPSYIFPEEHYALCRSWRDNALEYTKVTYSVSENVVSIDATEKVTLVVEVNNVNNVVAEKDNAISELNNEIASLNEKIEVLSKDSAELAEIKKEREEAELKIKREEIAEYARKSKRFTEEEMSTDSFKAIVESVDYASLKSMIADKVVAEVATKEEKEVAETVNLNSENAVFNVKSFISR